MSYAAANSPTFLAGLSRKTGIGVLTRLANMAELNRQRRALGSLDADQLSDIGVSAKDAETEAARPAWDAPDHWLK